MCERDSYQQQLDKCKCQKCFVHNQLLIQKKNFRARAAKLSPMSPHQHKNSCGNMEQQLKDQRMPQSPAPTYYSPNSSSGSSTSSASIDSSFMSDSHSSCSRDTLQSPPSASQSTPTIGVNLRVTGQCSQGGRKYMEDFFSVAYQQSENTKGLEYAFIGIYDGHGGAEAAAFAKEHLMMEIINQKLFWSDSDRDILRAIREGYIATHYAMWREQEKWPKTANGLPSTAGTTATIAFIRREKIYIGHVGDSGIVLGYQNDNEPFWRAKQLTTDHKPESVEERTRITRSGGKVVVKSGVPRVVWNRPRNAGHKGPIRRNTSVDEIPFLAVARSLGDLWSYNSAQNEFVVSPDPDVKVIKINAKSFRCLIFGTDGLWNVVSAQDAVNTVFEKEMISERMQARQCEDSPEVAGQWANPSKSLVDKALKIWSSKKMRADNTSVVTVILYPPSNIDSETDGELNSSFVSSNEHNAEPNSCGLEYTEMSADIVLDDHATTYQEMAEKYMPPSEYRNFNYFDENESEVVKPIIPKDDVEINHMDLNCDRTDFMYWHNIPDNIHDLDVCPSENLVWTEEQQKKVAVLVKAHNRSSGRAVEDNDCNESEEEEVDAENAENVEYAEANTPRLSDTDFSHFSETSPSISLGTRLSNASEESSCYMNSFAESYNSLLNEQISHEASTSNSNPSFQSISGSSMHEILQEQQLYQQQCMSEEEGYSLTKLETRREQQRCANGVQTFKIFQQNHEPLNETNYNAAHTDETEQAQPTESWDSQFPIVMVPTSKFLSYQQQEQSQEESLDPLQQPIKPLELNSLLQQEIEEEQQVALERLEMQRNLLNANETNDNSSTSFAYILPTSLAETDVDDDTLIEEYLDEEMSFTVNDENAQIDGVTTNNIDSNSRCSSTITLKTEIEKRRNSDLRPTSSVIIEEIEILHGNPEMVINNINPAEKKKKSKTHGHCSSLITRAIAKHTHLDYPNIPNENDRSSMTVSKHTLHSKLQLKHHVNNMRSTAAAVASSNGNCEEQRQLRSTTGLVEYSKRTLRTRNSLTKDIKLKTSLKRTSSLPTHILHASAANILVGKSELPECSTTSESCKKPKMEKFTVSAAPIQMPPSYAHVINLRSRQIGNVKKTTNLDTTTNSTSTITAATATAKNEAIQSSSLSIRRERRNLRSLNTKNNTKESVLVNSSGTSAIASYSKSTRQQSSSSPVLAVPPPSPKLINAARAVAAATRRSALRSANGAIDERPNSSNDTHPMSPQLQARCSRASSSKKLKR